MIEAAGGLVEDGRGRIAVVHRPRYDDWSLPKGKLDAGETHEAAALREVEEEIGLRCELVEELPEARYTDHKGRPKRVRYWRMRVLGGEFERNDEVDEMRWAPPGEAAALLTYDFDRRLAAGAAGAPGATP